MPEEPAPPKLAKGQLLFLLACALLIGFVGGRSVAEAAGAISLEDSGQPFDRLHGDQGVWIFVSILMCTFFVFASLRFLLLLGQRGVGLLARVQTRPEAWISVSITGCGVLCLIAAVALQWHQASASATVSLPTIDMPGMPKGMNFGGVSVRGARTSLMAPLTTVVVLLAGLAIAGVGIWSSIPPRRLRFSKTGTRRQGPASRAESGVAQSIRADPNPR